MTPTPELALEGHPSDDQKERLRDFLTELMLLVHKYGVLLRDEYEAVEIIDLTNSHLIGVGLTYWTDPGDDHKILGFEVADSILDGVWLVDTPDGPVEQHLVMNVHPGRRLS